MVFHAGTKIYAAGEIETVGGPVLGMTARAATLGEETMRAYEAVGVIWFDGCSSDMTPEPLGNM
jgi:phosphoribosylamine-glycine ligase